MNPVIPIRGTVVPLGIENRTVTYSLHWEGIVRLSWCSFFAMDM
ncbi:MAG: hypothetical protein R3B84_10225 [Zavarzinella sp.]